MNTPLALYIHWPFCASKCPYCDFASRPGGGEENENAWAQGLLKEMAAYARETQNRPLSSIYFGGGTPSLLAPQTVARILEKSVDFWPHADAIEITLEANPSSSEIEKFRAFRAAGVNRLSLGVQALDDDALRFLGRAHDAQTARRAIESAAATFDRFSFDLIYARRDQTLAAWEKELDEALTYRPRHLSLYQLTIEPGTPFAKRAQKEPLIANEPLAADMFEFTQEKTRQAGLPAYEISNHAVPGQESRHNLTYWHYEDYLGLGPAAHGRFVTGSGERVATANPAKSEAWLKAIHENKREIITTETAQTEALLMGLRLTEGINRVRWQKKFGVDVLKIFSEEKIKKLCQEDLLTLTGAHFTGTNKGRQRLSALLSYLLG